MQGSWAQTLKYLLIISCGLVLSACQTIPDGGLTREQVAVLQQEGFTLTDDGWELNLSSKILFEVDEHQVVASDADIIQSLTRALLNVGIDRIRLDGHSDATGSEQYNLTLSKRRAETVATVMQAAGMHASQIQIVGRGAQKPIADNSTPAGRRENRRVVIIVASY